MPKRCRKTNAQMRSSRTQQPALIRFPDSVDCPAFFDVERGDVLDLTGVRVLYADALPGLVRLAQRGAVQLRLVEDSQPFRTIERHFGVDLIPDLFAESGYLLIV